MERLVTAKDLKDNPELHKQGVQINQHYEFGDEPLDENTTSDEEDTAPAKTKKVAPKKAADKKAAPKKAAQKKKGK